jgi:hypothetical protein
MVDEDNICLNLAPMRPGVLRSACCCVRTTSTWHDTSLTRFETSSANKANTPDEIIPANTVEHPSPLDVIAPFLFAWAWMVR